MFSKSKVVSAFCTAAGWQGAVAVATAAAAPAKSTPRRASTSAAKRGTKNHANGGPTALQPAPKVLEVETQQDEGSGEVLSPSRKDEESEGPQTFAPAIAPHHYAQSQHVKEKLSKVLSQFPKIEPHSPTNLATTHDDGSGEILEQTSSEQGCDAAQSEIQNSDLSTSPNSAVGVTDAGSAGDAVTASALADEWWKQPKNVQGAKQFLIGLGGKG